MTLYFANMTSWHDTATGYLAQSAAFSKADVMAVAEHHRRGTHLTQLLKKLRTFG